MIGKTALLLSLLLISISFLLVVVDKAEIDGSSDDSVSSDGLVDVVKSKDDLKWDLNKGGHIPDKLPDDASLMHDDTVDLT